jgi:gamma-glutamyl-gamma-aminobutyrate hydrolase PuuD
MEATEIKACFSAVYVKWIESAGARVAIIPYDADLDTIDALLGSVNGVLFTGGELHLEFGTQFVTGMFTRLCRHKWHSPVHERQITHTHMNIY